MTVQSFVDGIKRSLSEQTDSLTWRRVTVPGLDVAWVGMNVPALDTGGRPWVWEVVTPRCYDSTPRLGQDPMVLAVEHDAVVAEIHHVELGSPVVTMQVPVRHSPDALQVASGLAPDSPWSLRLQVGWTVQALGNAAQCWIDEQVPGTVRLETPQPLRPLGQSYKLHPEIDIESAAFDRLLTLKPHDAAVVTSLLARIHEALAPYR